MDLPGPSTNWRAKAHIMTINQGPFTNAKDIFPPEKLLTGHERWGFCRREKGGRKRTDLIWKSTGHEVVKVEIDEHSEVMTKVLYTVWVKGIWRKLRAGDRLQEGLYQPGQSITGGRRAHLIHRTRCVVGSARWRPFSIRKELGRWRIDRLLLGLVADSNLSLLRVLTCNLCCDRTRPNWGV